jgi:hypothetical protein
MPRESRDRRVVLAALRAVAPSALTLLRLYYLTGLPEQRVQAALVRLEALGLIRGAQVPARESPGRRRVAYHAVPARGAGRLRRWGQPAGDMVARGRAVPGRG